MKTKYHIEISRKALKNHFSDEVIEKIIRANIKQDLPKNQFGHDEIHFDSSTFTEGFAYINENETKLYKAISESDYEKAWASLGKILHSWQDFYSHSNYVHLWKNKVKEPVPDMIDPNDLDIFRSQDLKSGKNYGLPDYLALIPGISKLVTPRMPADSHAKMNLDSPKSGPSFEFVFHAAQKQSVAVINQILIHIEDQNFNQENINAFLGKLSA